MTKQNCNTLCSKRHRITRLQIARLQRRYGLTASQARLVAELHYGGRRNG